MSKKWKIVIGIAVAVVLAVVLMGSLRNKDRNLPHVTTAKVEKVDLVSKVTANGKIQAHRKVDLSALVMGQIVNLAVQEGDKVKKGQLLLQIDKAQLAAAAREARRASPRCATISRPQRLPPSRRGSTTSAPSRTTTRRSSRRPTTRRPGPTLDTARANLAATEERMRQASATLAGSRDSLSKTTVTAPDHRHRHRASDQGRRGHGHRHDEQRGHAAADHLRHVGRGSGHDGGRDLHAAGQGRTDRRADDRRLSREEVQGGGHRGRVLADSQDRPRPAVARRQLRGDQLQGLDPGSGPAPSDSPRLLRDRRDRDRPQRRARPRSRSRRSSSATSRRRTRRRPAPREGRTRKKGSISSRTASSSSRRSRRGSPASS